jgi:hypothetical protein
MIDQMGRAQTLALQCFKNIPAGGAAKTLTPPLIAAFSVDGTHILGFAGPGPQINGSVG